MSSGAALEKYKQGVQVQKRWWSLGSEKYEKAVQCFEAAANLYRLDNKLDLAGEATEQAALMYLKLDSKYEAATALVKAAILYRKVNPTATIKLYQHAIEIYSELGKFPMVARNQLQLAEMYEELLDYAAAIHLYENAAECFDIDTNAVSARKCLTKVAELSATLERYDRAIEIYQGLAQQQLTHTATKWNVSTTFFRTGLCYLANQDLIGLKRSLEVWKEMSPGFDRKREAIFLQNILTIIEEPSTPHRYTELCYDYDSASTLDSLTVALLLRIKINLIMTPSSSSATSNPIPEDYC